jgi:hypothetical protein
VTSTTHKHPKNPSSPHWELSGNLKIRTSTRYSNDGRNDQESSAKVRLMHKAVPVMHMISNRNGWDPLLTSSKWYAFDSRQVAADLLEVFAWETRCSRLDRSDKGRSPMGGDNER